MEKHIGSSADPAYLEEGLLPTDTEMPKKINLEFPEDPLDITTSVGGRVRLYSESQVYTINRLEESEPTESNSTGEEDMGDNGAPFRGRSQSAPAALWAAKRYGSQLRRMSDEFDTWLDRVEVKRGGLSASRLGILAWFSFLWSTQEEEEEEGRE